MGGQQLAPAGRCIGDGILWIPDLLSTPLPGPGLTSLTKTDERAEDDRF